MGIPVTIVSGFLGAGKTTLINQALQVSPYPREEIIIIENEFGEVGIDHKLLVHSEERVLQLNNGCMCCSLRSDLLAILISLLETIEEHQQPISQIIIETTGIADPQPIIQTLLTAPQLRGRVYIDSLLTVIDSDSFELIEREPQALKQLVMADRIFVSRKQNLNLSALKKLQREIKSINPLSDIRMFTHSETIQKRDFYNLKKFNHPLVFESDSSENHYNGKYYHQHHQVHEFKSILLTSDQDIKKDFLLQWIDWLILTNQGSLYRFKGLIALQEQDFIVAMQEVNEQVNFQYTTRQKDQTTIILIGKMLDEERIKQSFDKLLAESK
ncbi:TPA: GTP-binding protein [Enterococcus faecium]|nr:GTP-binding protein [Enterococcus faecium]HAP9804282.1 GTP-binding protein [Enterococcus faecium]HAQ2443551.1 GTP-binding protein [Enterococcus faecium]HAQ2772328.1 GTP-binding protein [Enterococcus faecium]HAQ3868591.1 GTP-binding protein [Enterococcus faecium]